MTSEEPQRKNIVGFLRGWTLWALAAFCVLAVGFALGLSFAEPKEPAVAAKAVSKTAPVTVKELKVSVAKRGLVQSAELKKVTYVGDAAQPIITKLPLAQGNVVKEGSVLAEVSGRPLIVLQGDIPNYRAMEPAMRGKDVLQLERSLSRLGYTVGKVDGVFDQQTSKAIRAMYRDRHYQTKKPDQADGQEAGATSSAADIARAELDVTVAQKNLARLEGQLGSATDGQARERDTTTAREKTEPQSPVAEAGEPSQPAAETDSANEPRGGAEKAYELKIAKLNLRIAQATLDDLRKKHQTQSEVRTIVPRGEVVFLPELPVNLMKIEGAVGGSPGENMFTLGTGGVYIDVLLSRAESQGVTLGSKVAVRQDTATDIVTGSVVEIRPKTAATEDGKEGQTIVKVAPDTAMPLESAGQTVTVTFTVGETDGEVFVVPTAAISVDASGATFLRLKENELAEPTKIPVTTGLVAEGLVQVEPADGGALKAGNLVLTDQKGADRGSTEPK